MFESASRFANFLKTGRRDRTRATPARSRPRFGVEILEPRALLTGSGLGTDYTLMGGKWDNSQTITYSFAPDGVMWDKGVNVLNSKLDAEFGGTSWQALVADAFQVWAAVTNLNFVEVADSDYDFNASGVNEGDPNFGDIRIGGYNFSGSTTIATTYGPPPNGQTGAGDVELNTAYNFGAGSTYDFETAMIHEIGHSLGLGESPQPSSVMYTYYHGVDHTLSPYDIEGIQSLYGARNADAYQSQGQATSASTALNLTPDLNSSNQATLIGASLASIGDVEYFSVTAPAINGSTLQVDAQAGGYSLLTPKVSVIDPSTGTTIATNATPDPSDNTTSVSIPGAQAGHRYIIAVTGATNNDFAIGSYALRVGFSGGTSVNPAPTPTPTPTPAPTPKPTPAPVVVTHPASPAIQPDQFAYNSSFASATELGSLSQTSFANLTLPSASNYQLFAFEVPKAGVVLVAAGNANVVVGNASAQPVASGTGLIAFVAPQAGARYFVLFLSPNSAPVANYGFALKLIPKATVVTPATTTSVVSTSHPKSGVKARSVIAVARPKAPSRKTTRPTQ